ncbi:transcription factor HHO3-like [Rutidosis leptorrhynchoides]|uniref:transcription factor HHO3-like n=1 Tax=Rutidosis leptorrhynchoides TaxID=125765 RepID=UPI003A98F4C5
MIIYNNPVEFKEQMKVSHEYIEALEEELKKIQMFERELPLCLELVSQAIERCRYQMFGTITDHSLNDGPVLKEFIPIKPNYLSTENDDNIDEEHQLESNQLKVICGTKDKSDWLTSSQLPIQTQDPTIEKDMLHKKSLDMEVNDLFRKEKNSGSCSTDTAGDGGGDGEDKGPSNNKKERRCWSPELHRQFLHALQQLGGDYVATPKQIKEIMKVDGLTNDEIKSHLQKYRLHTRRSNPNNNVRTPQLVVVGQIWVPPLEYTAKTAPSSCDDAKTTLYSPIATLPTSVYKTKQLKQESHLVRKRRHTHS